MVVYAPVVSVLASFLVLVGHQTADPCSQTTACDVIAMMFFVLLLCLFPIPCRAD